MSKVLGIFLFLVQLSLQQKDPLNDFCRRFGSQTAIVDRKLYIDGGMLNWNPIAQNKANYSNPYLLYSDLDVSPPGVDMPQLHANLSKNASMPSVSGGVLWQDNVNKRFYLFGGDYPNNPVIAPNAPNLLSYDVLYNQWQSFGQPTKGIQSVSWGAGVGISELGQGFVLGGWLSNNSVPGWTGGPIATSTLIKYTYDTNEWTNTTGPDEVPRAEGVMLYVPASDSGLLIYFGGVTVPYYNETVVAEPMDTIHIYDIRSSKWYVQKTTGPTPGSRRRFCAGAAWTADQSSYNIYMYGGMGFGTNSSGYDDVWILSLPTFTWISWWQPSGTGVPHHSLTCNVVGNGQMLVIGGTFPLNDQCDSPPTWGTHNLDLGKREGKMWNVYKPNITTYVAPPEVVQIVGGSSTGGASAKAPVKGFDTGSGDLSVYFGQRASVAVRSPTRAIPTATSTNTSTKSTKLSTGAIAGIAVGGAVVLIALIIGACCLIRRHRRNKPPPPVEVPYNPVYAQVPNTPHSPYSPNGAYQDRDHHYQLAANPAPAELSTNDYREHSDPTKLGMVQVHEGHPAYNDWQGSPPPRHMSPTNESPYPTMNSSGTIPSPNTPYSHGQQTSPTPTYSSVQRPPRRTANQTYYSP